MDTNHKGNLAEFAIAKEAAHLGLSVLKPLTEHERYDLVINVAGRLLRIQCKWATCRGGVVRIRFKTSYHSPTRGYVVSKYTDTDVDAIAAYCGDLDRCYLLPIDRVSGTGDMTLRIQEARNNQRAALNWAAEYEFRGAVAQLEERVAGSDEVRGSSPLSSTPFGADPSTQIEVGAHEFRNRFGYYMERAAAGTEVLVRRRGKPHARLVPPQ